MKLITVVFALSSTAVVVGAQLLSAWCAASIALAPLGYDFVEGNLWTQALAGVAAYALSRGIAAFVVAVDAATGASGSAE